MMKIFFIKGKQFCLFCGVQGLMTGTSSTKHLQFRGLLGKLGYCSWARWSL